MEVCVTLNCSTHSVVEKEMVFDKEHWSKISTSSAKEGVGREELNIFLKGNGV